MQQPIVFSSGGRDLFGTLHVPEKPHEPPFSALLMLHGFTGDRTEKHRLFVKAARRIAREGILALRFDFRCCGESEGDFEELRLDGMRNDTLEAMRLLRRREDVDGRRVALCGISLGGAIASSVAARRGAEAKCLVLWAAVADLPRAFDSLAPAEIASRRGERRVHDYFGNAMSGELIDDLMGFRPAEEARRYRGPVLIVHGSADDSISPDDAARYARALRDRGPVRMHIIEGADHTFAGLAWERELIEETVGFLREFLIGANER